MQKSFLMQSLLMHRVPFVLKPDLKSLLMKTPIGVIKELKAIRPLVPSRIKWIIGATKDLMAIGVVKDLIIIWSYHRI